MAVALLMLVVITLLGLAAVRATQVELKLSQNAESRMTAIQAADSMVSFTTNATTLPVNDDLNFTACAPAGAVIATVSCVTAGIDTGLATTPLKDHGYAMVRREAPLFVEVNVLREAALSAKNYDFARFTIIGGYDRSADRKSAAEITQGTLKLHTKVAGVNYE